ncbi:DUF6164 family protein [Flavobacterium sp. MXW15]|uniref:DUF6164 family protein n=1 Tax=Xanthomonas chitinilytica TaxID=2989819 RepID=A0ABT3K012_9XANT|nr:DUF6164 family protein [Xanthomonas sp. H13-6]MCW4456348.1 DUF6164 family protein [Flavobacterium sp. MXW15]MCW4474054.1 DUF6164 family protein [Xanthomonas sp. H13-6]
MSKLLLNLRNVAEDEADDVRALLDAHRIGYYETRPSPWGISAGGIWIKDNTEHPRAKALMADYQAARGERVRAEREAALRDGTAETFGTLIRRRPLFVLATLVAMLLVASLVLLPFFLLTR